MGKKTPKAPAAPDPVKTAEAQAAANKEAILESAKVNQINEVTPFGTTTFSGEIGEPDRTRTISLTEPGQQVLDAQQAIALGLTNLAGEQIPRVSGTLNSPFNLDGLPLPPQASDEARRRVEAALLDRLNPLLERDQDRLNTRLAAQGITQGSEAFRNAQDDFARARNDARLAAVAQGGAEQSRLFDLAQRARQQGISERVLERGQPLNELAALLQGAPAIGTPASTPVSQFQIAPPDILGAQALDFQARQNAFNQAVSRQNAATGGLFGLGGAVIGAL